MGAHLSTGHIAFAGCDRPVAWRVLLPCSWRTVHLLYSGCGARGACPVPCPAAAANPFVDSRHVRLTPPVSARADLEWKIVYVGSADSTDHDQELQDVLVGPVPVGMNRFILEVTPPRRC